jgi:hypothetical protein
MTFNDWRNIRTHYGNSLFFKEERVEELVKSINSSICKGDILETIKNFEYFLFEATSFFDIFLRYLFINSNSFRREAIKGYGSSDYNKIKHMYFSERTFSSLRRNKQYYKLKKLFDYGLSKKQEDSYSLKRLVEYRNSIAHNSELMEIYQSIEENISNHKNIFLPDNSNVPLFFKYESNKKIELGKFCNKILVIIRRIQRNKNNFSVYLR